MVATRTLKKKMYVFQCFACICVCAPLISLVPSEALEALELELQVVCDHTRGPGAKLGSSGRATSVLSQ